MPYLIAQGGHGRTIKVINYFVSDVHLLLAKETVITDKNRGLLARHGDHH